MSGFPLLIKVISHWQHHDVTKTHLNVHDVPIQAKLYYKFSQFLYFLDDQTKNDIM